MEKVKKVMTVIVMLLIVCTASLLIMTFVYRNGVYPEGSDTMCHLYKGDALYKELLKGNFYPLFDPMWYNGVEPLRYWAPLPVYFLALCEALTGGNVFYGYILFVGLIFALGTISWMVIGYSHKRPYLGFFLGALWFFMPNNLFALFVEGNLPRALCMVILPLFISYLYDYLLENKWAGLVKLIVALVLMVFCHLGYAGMIVLTVCVFLLLYGIMYKDRKKAWNVLVGMFSAFLLTGIWSVASLFGGISSTNSSQVMKGFFQSLFVTLNPVRRITVGFDEFYFGVAAFGLIIFGLVSSKKQSRIGFWTALIVLLLSVPGMYYALVMLPGSEYLWMLRFISIALCLVLYSLFLWNTLKHSWLFVVAFLLILDCIPSCLLIYGDGSRRPAESRFEKMEGETLIQDAKDITNQRLALIDLSSLGTMGCFLISDWGEPVQATFGAGWQSAATAYNIVQLNQAAEDGNFLYLFDRMIELGTDTVLISKKTLEISDYMVKAISEAAESLGYYWVNENSDFVLYHKDTPKQFGVKSVYTSIGIGSSAPQMALTFPCIEETESNNLNDYTYDELSKYDTIYIAGFEYDDREAAEQMLLRLSEEGKRIIILADGIPAVEKSGTPEFLGVQCFNITFTNGFPELITKNGVLNCKPFYKDAREWKTVYINGLDEVWGGLSDLGNGLDFYGTKCNENIIFIGLNLTYHYALTHDRTIGELLADVFALDAGRLPYREIYPIELEYGKNIISVTSLVDGLNTTISYHDNFYSDRNIESLNHLTVVNSGKTLIKIRYPYMFWGGIVSIAGFILTVFLLVAAHRQYKKQGAQNNE